MTEKAQNPIKPNAFALILYHKGALSNSTL